MSILLRTAFGCLLVLAGWAQASNFVLPNTLFASISPTEDTVTITGATTIKSGAKLTLRPGTVVRANAALTVEGTLVAAGTAADSIRFEAASPSAKWGGLIWKGSDGPDSSFVAFATFQGLNKRAISVTNRNALAISHSRFSALDSGAISVSNASFRVHHNVFEKNQSTRLDGVAISWTTGTPWIDNNLFLDNQARSGALFLSTVSRAVVEYNIFQDNRNTPSQTDVYGMPGRGGAMHTHASSAEIRHNEFRLPGYTSTGRFGAIAYLGGSRIAFRNNLVEKVSGDDVLTPPVTLLADTSLVENTIFRDIRSTYTNLKPSLPYSSLSHVYSSDTARGGALFVNARVAVLSGVLAYRDTINGPTGKVAQGAGAYVLGSSQAIVVNSTFTKNVAWILGEKHRSASAPGVYVKGDLYNSIVYGNEAHDFVPPVELNASKPHFSIIGKDPGFVDFANDHFALAATSPYLDAGYILAPYIAATDLDGKPRNVHQSVDPGAYEFQQARPAHVMGWFNRDTTLTGAHDVINNVYVLDGVKLTFAAGSSFDIGESVSIESYGTLVTRGTQAQPVILRAESATGWNGIRGYLKSVQGTEDDYALDLDHVTISGTETFENAMYLGERARGRMNHMVLHGRFYLSMFAKAWVDSSIFVRHGNSESVVETYDSRIYLSHSSIYSGLVTLQGDSSYLNRVDFRPSSGLNLTSAGGQTIVENSRFENARIASSGSHLFRNILVHSFSDPANSPITASKGTVILNSTIVNNAFYGISAQAAFTLQNSVLWNNYSSQAQQINWKGSGTPVINNSCIQNGWSGVGIITADPLFVDTANGDFRLQASSPCVNAGDTTGFLDRLSAQDLAGEHRIRDNQIDIGAYEYQSGDVYLFASSSSSESSSSSGSSSSAESSSSSAETPSSSSSAESSSSSAEAPSSSSIEVPVSSSSTADVSSSSTTTGNLVQSHQPRIFALETISSMPGVRFTLRQPALVRLQVFDMLGQMMQQEMRYLSAGHHVSDLSSLDQGHYRVLLRTDSQSEQIRLDVR